MLLMSNKEAQLLVANSLDVMRTLDNESVPLIIADPPYGIGYHSNHYREKNPHSPVTNDWNFQIGGFLHECGRVLKDGGALYLFCRWDVMPLWIPYVSGVGLKTKTAIAWVKDNWSAGDLTGCFGNQYEQILFIAKGRHLLRGKRWPNVWQFPRVSHKRMLHPTEKPVSLLERAILASSDVGDLVVDPFAGSGSTGQACFNTGRRALLVEIDPRMARIAANRLGVETTGLQINETESPPAPVLLDFPTPEEWGIHPDELLAISAAMAGNVQAQQECLFDLDRGLLNG